jgi:pilus assembly protein CpaD
MSSNRPLRLILRLAPLALAGLLAACAADSRGPKGLDQAITPTEQYPLKVAEVPGQIRLAAHPQGLSEAQRAAVEALADHWLQEGGGPVTIRVPNAGVDPRAADVTSGQAADVLRAEGVPGEQIRRVAYDATGEGVAPIVVAYTTFRAEIPRCGLKWENLSTNSQNKPMENFGCAVNANMAAQIADPADIAFPRAADSTDAGRRTTVIDKYRQGQSTAGATEAGASGTLSTLGGGGGSN